MRLRLMLRLRRESLRGLPRVMRFGLGDRLSNVDRLDLGPLVWVYRRRCVPRMEKLLGRRGDGWRGRDARDPWGRSGGARSVRGLTRRARNVDRRGGAKTGAYRGSAHIPLGIQGAEQRARAYTAQRTRVHAAMLIQRS